MSEKVRPAVASMRCLTENIELWVADDFKEKFLEEHRRGYHEEIKYEPLFNLPMTSQIVEGLLEFYGYFDKDQEKTPTE